MNFKLKGAIAAFAMFVVNNAHAVIADPFDPANLYGSDIVISIFNTATSQSALIDTNVNAVTLASSPAAFTISDAAITSFLGTGSATDFVYAVMGVQGNNLTSTGDDFGTLVTRAGPGPGPQNFSGFSSLISGMAGDFGNANADPNFSAVDIATGLTSGGAFHANVTGTASSLNFFNIEGALDTDIAFAWTHFDLGTGAIVEETIGYWNINSSTGQIAFSTTPSAVPVPAAVWLFGSGLLGLVGVARRRKV
jgi:hypothetical protein